MGGTEALARFLNGAQENASFHHRDHLAAAFTLLGLMPFTDAAALYGRALRELAARAGRPGAYHTTVTLAFLSLVAERMAKREFASFEAFLDANPDLARKDILHRWYTPAKLDSALARSTFLLPEPRQLVHRGATNEH